MGGTDNVKRIFRENLRAWVANRPVGVVAHSLGMSYKQLHRWLAEGIERPDYRSFPHILKVAEAIQLSDWKRLWEDGLLRPRPPDPHEEARESCFEKAVFLLEDDVWLPSLIEVINRLWEQRERSLAGSTSPENVDQEPGSGGEHMAK